MDDADEYAYEMYLQEQDEARQERLEEHAFLMHVNAVDVEAAVDALMASLDHSPEAVDLADAWLRVQRHLGQALEATATFGG